MTKAIYAFSGDPITFGHIDIIKRAAQVFDQLVVAIGVNPDKNYLFSLEERTKLAQEALAGMPAVEVTSFTGLLVDFAYEINADVIIKGVRNPTDFEYETNLFRMGDSQELGIDSFILIAKPELAHVSSSAVKQIQAEQGFIEDYVPLNVKQALEAKINNQYIIAVTGEIGSGKSYVSEQFAALGKEQGIEVHNIELDSLTHQIYQDLPQPKYKQIRNTIADTFGSQVQNPDGSINRKKLGEIVFNDYQQLQQLNQILHKPHLVRIKRELYGKQGLIILTAALIVEANMASLANNHVCLVTADKETQKQRLKQRKLTEDQIQRRLNSQYTFQEKKKKLSDSIQQAGFGQIWQVDNSGQGNREAIKNTFNDILSRFELKAD